MAPGQYAVPQWGLKKMTAKWNAIEVADCFVNTLWDEFFMMNEWFHEFAQECFLRGNSYELELELENDLLV